MKRENAAADADPESVRLSIDTKAVINIGPYSRGGLSRGLRPVAAADHDLMAKEKLVPGGVLEMGSGRPFLFFTESCKTSDFMVDGLQLWWRENQGRMAGIKRVVINLDNGPECSGHRSQFLRRMVAFADREELEVRLIYYPPYPSKYNGIERYWGGLERSWNGYLARQRCRSSPAGQPVCLAIRPDDKHPAQRRLPEGRQTLRQRKAGA